MRKVNIFPFFSDSTMKTQLLEMLVVQVFIMLLFKASDGAKTNEK